MDTKRFSDAKLTFENEKVEDGKPILESQKEFEYSGSFRIAEMDDETDEYISIKRIRQTLHLHFAVDGEKSGSEPNPDGTPVGEVTTGSKRVSSTRVDRSNVLHFEGKMKAPRGAGEHELRLAIIFNSKDGNKRICILKRLVKVVEPKTPNATDN